MLLTTHRRRVLAALLAALVPSAASAKRHHKKKGKCTGPCTYELCTRYVFARHPINDSYNRAIRDYLDAECCGRLSLTYRGKKYRDAVVACIKAEGG